MTATKGSQVKGLVLVDDSPMYLDTLEHMLTQAGIPVAQKILFWDEALSLTTSDQMLSESEVEAHEQGGHYMVVRSEEALQALLPAVAKDAKGVLCDYGLSEGVRGTDIRRQMRGALGDVKMVVHSATGTLPAYADGRYHLSSAHKDGTLPDVLRKPSRFDEPESLGLKLAYLRQEFGLEVPSASVSDVAEKGPAKGEASVKR